MRHAGWLILLIQIGIGLWVVACTFVATMAAIMIKSIGSSAVVVAVIAVISAVVGGMCGQRLTRCLAKRMDVERRGFTILPPR